MAYQYVFGPVLSGRLGLSLGLDLLGCRACSMDCVYCEVGATEILTLTRKVYAPAKDILAELEDWASQGLETEYVTLGGSGEPCLNTEMAAVIDGVRRILPGKKIAVLTNSTLLTDPQVRRELAGADVVLPSMDTLVESEFRRINRTHRNISALDIAKAMLIFRREYAGLIHL
ncbi:MAG: radical SAM protein, partial [Proteobacteria bacterium]|nr:radical SAM protein [Pseudomonadota bacterium]MBU1611480.1 radical SAM protein [Pseudomonadota bacterium]